MAGRSTDNASTATLYHRQLRDSHDQKNAHAEPSNQASRAQTIHFLCLLRRQALKPGHEFLRLAEYLVSVSQGVPTV